MTVPDTADLFMIAWVLVIGVHYGATMRKLERTRPAPLPDPVISEIDGMIADVRMQKLVIGDRMDVAKSVLLRKTGQPDVWVVVSSSKLTALDVHAR